MLARKHPEHFNPLGGSLWQGRIYAPANLGLRTRRPMIYHGRFGGGAFQGVYSAAPSFALMAATSLEYHVLVSGPLLVISAAFTWLLPLALASLGVSLAVCAIAAWQAELPRQPRRPWSRPLVGLLYALQPVVRGWARYQERLFRRLTPLSRRESLDSLGRNGGARATSETGYRDRSGRGREGFLQDLLARLELGGWQHRVDAGWGSFDVEVYGSRWSKLQLTTVTEHDREGGVWVRCRLKTRWTLPARLGLGLAIGLAVLAAAALREHGAAVWWFNLFPAGLAVAFERDQRVLRRVFAVFLDAVAGVSGQSRPALPAAASLQVPGELTRSEVHPPVPGETPRPEA
jgi:hypothetical protein